VKAVSPASPAEAAGLRVGDLLYGFGLLRCDRATAPQEILSRLPEVRVIIALNAFRLREDCCR
jgi:predicted metalloprotease with PDZ domain